MIKIGDLVPDDDNKDDLAKLLEDWENDNQEFIQHKKDSYLQKLKDKWHYKNKGSYKKKRKK